MSVPSGKTISGRLRLYVTFYRAGFLVITMVAPIVSADLATRDDLAGKSKRLISDGELMSSDLEYLLENLKDPVYPVETDTATKKSSSIEILEDVREIISNLGIRTVESRAHGRALFCWKVVARKRLLKAKEIVQKYPVEVFQLLFTPSTETERTDKMTLDLLQREHITETPRGSRFSMSPSNLLVINPIILTSRRRITAIYGYNTELFAIYQLLKLQSYMLQCFNDTLKAHTQEVEKASQVQYGSIVKKLANLNRSMSFCMEELYWIEYEIRLLKVRDSLREYKAKWGIDSSQRELASRGQNLERLTTALSNTVEVEAAKKADKGFKMVSLIFASFAGGDALIAVLIWYMTAELENRPIPISYLIWTLYYACAFVIVVLLIGYLYVERNQPT
jgi:hypothetical protein